MSGGAIACAVISCVLTEEDGGGVVQCQTPSMKAPFLDGVLKGLLLNTLAAPAFRDVDCIVLG
jgi:hypothetical protein